ncbi:MAG: hypothetical protein ACRD3F_15235 [Acidobacteriaceae bacterium]
MATVAGMAWDAARRAFMAGYESYQARGPMQHAPWHERGDKRCGLWTAGRDAAKKRVPREHGWEAFRKREEEVM